MGTEHEDCGHTAEEHVRMKAEAVSEAKAELREAVNALKEVLHPLTTIYLMMLIISAIAFVISAAKGTVPWSMVWAIIPFAAMLQILYMVGVGIWAKKKGLI